MAWLLSLETLRKYDPTVDYHSFNTRRQVYHLLFRLKIIKDDDYSGHR